MLRLEVITPNGSVLDAKVNSVTAPGEMGEFQVLSQHLPMLTLLGGGRLSYQHAQGTDSLFLRGGVVEVNAEGHVLILTNEVQETNNLDVKRARDIQEKAQNKLAKSQFLTDETLADLRKDLAFADAVLTA